jgi:uncharacterized membrane protein YbaN (DUF454 family)
MKKKIFIILSFVSLGFGILGMFLPILPTTPFLLLSAALFAKSSTQYYQWLLNHKHFGQYIRDFRENKSIPLRIKIISITTLWVTILISIIFAAKGMLLLQIMLAAIAIGVSIHILSFKTKR